MSRKKTRKTTARPRRLFEGLPVVDADEDVTLTITSPDIAGSKIKSPDQCAAARAGHRELHTDVKVFMSRMYVKEKTHWTRYVTPENASRELISFDRGSAFEPGPYTFKAPSPGQRIGYRRAIVHTSTGAGVTRRRPHHVTGNVRPSAKERYNNSK